MWFTGSHCVTTHEKLAEQDLNTILDHAVWKYIVLITSHLLLMVTHQSRYSMDVAALLTLLNEKKPLLQL